MRKRRRLRPPADQFDWMQEDNARALAAYVKDYWLEQGYRGIRVWLEKDTRITAAGRHKTDYFVRSNVLRTGFPPVDAIAVAA